MNIFFKYIIGSVTYCVKTGQCAKKAGELMSCFPDEVFDVKIINEHVFVFSCTAFSEKKVIHSGLFDNFEIEKTKSIGLIYYFLKHKKRAGLLVGAVIFILIAYLQSFIVWEIRVSGNNIVEDAEIIKKLSDIGFSVGKKIEPQKLGELENSFLIADRRISWISINMSGTVAFVEVKERSVKEDLSETPSMTGIVALKDCIIELSEVTSGTSLVTAGQTVQKGEMIISPVAQGKDGNEYLVGAFGSVLAKTYEEFFVKVYYHSIVPSFTGKAYRDNTFSFLGKNFTVKPIITDGLNKFILKNRYEKVRLFKGAGLPMTKTEKEKIEYILTEEIITPEAARNKAYAKMYSKIASELPDAEILSTTFSEVEEDDSFLLRCKVECIRDVAVFASDNESKRHNYD